MGLVSLVRCERRSVENADLEWQRVLKGLLVSRGVWVRTGHG